MTCRRPETQSAWSAFTCVPVIAIIVAGASFFACSDRSPEPGTQPPAERDNQAQGQTLEITTYPSEGDVLQDLHRPIVVDFSNRVEPDAFSFRLVPDSEGWSETWERGHRRVVLKHPSAFQPDRSYDLEVTVADSASAAVTFSTEGPSSLELIARDETAGVIDLDTAWIRRLQYVFEYDAMPEQYRSATPVHDVDAVLSGFLGIRSQLRAETLDRLRPYTVRPDHPDSVFSPFLTPTKNARSSAGPSGWVRAAFAEEPEPGANAAPPGRPASMVHVRCSNDIVVWSGAEDRPFAQLACELIRDYSMYEKFERLLNRSPSEDAALCQTIGGDSDAVEECVEDMGGDRSLDIYVVPGSYVYPGVSRWAGLCVPEFEVSPRKATAYILVKPATDITVFASTIAHEIFHAFQFAIDFREDPWWMEATANWAQEYLESNWTTEVWLKYVFDSAFNKQRQLNLADGRHEYGAYLFPFYLEKIQPGTEQVIADIWAACEGRQSLEALDSVLEGGFNETLRDFSVANLGLDPHDDRYPPPLDLFPLHQIQKSDLEPDEEHDVEIDTRLAPLTARYLQWVNQLDPNRTPLVRFELDGFAGNDALFLHAIIYTDDGEFEEDWSDRTERRFCINREEENFDKIILIPVSAERPIALPPAPANPPPGTAPQRPENMQPEVVTTVTISVETEACRPSMGSGTFTIELDTHDEDLAVSYTFTERVSAEVFFDDFHPGNAEYTGRAIVHYEEHIEKHERLEKGMGVDRVRDTSIERLGRGEVECTLYYPWGEEDATYNLNCGTIEVHGKSHEVTTFTMRGERKETSNEWTETTDIDETYISSHYGGLPGRYDLEITGRHLDEDTSQGRTTRNFASWTFFLSQPPG